MLGLDIKIEDRTKQVEKAADRAIFKNVGHAAATIRKDAIASIVQAEGPSPPGSPPHTHTGGFTKKGKKRSGQLQRSIAYHHDRQKQEAIIGPRATVVGQSGEAHEFGGEYKGSDFPQRPFMWPALEDNLDRFASSFAGSIGS